MKVCHVAYQVHLFWSQDFIFAHEIEEDCNYSNLNSFQGPEGRDGRGHFFWVRVRVRVWAGLDSRVPRSSRSQKVEPKLQRGSLTAEPMVRQYLVESKCGEIIAAVRSTHCRLYPGDLDQVSTVHTHTHTHKTLFEYCANVQIQVQFCFRVCFMFQTQWRIFIYLQCILHSQISFSNFKFT